MQVNITVINDANEGGVSFTQEEYVVETSEATRVGEALVALRASAGGAGGAGAARLLYGVHASRAPASARLFRLHEFSGVLELAHPLDRSTTDFKCTVTKIIDARIFLLILFYSMTERALRFTS